MIRKATALAHPNIAFIKYWGLKDGTRRIPANDSISMNIGCLSTHTTVTHELHLNEDLFILNGKTISGDGLIRVKNFMDRIREMADVTSYVRVESENNFPVGAGLASSASGFAALTMAAAAVFDLEYSEKSLSSLARYGSGSACRSIPGGFVEWQTDPLTGESYAFSIAPQDHWQLADCIAILSQEHKPIGSESGMQMAGTSPFQEARVLDSQRRIDLCRSAILNKDFDALAQVTELDSNMMHAVMMTSNPSLFYWHPQSLVIMKAVKEWQEEGLPVTYTLDAGPNVHVICTQNVMDEVLKRLNEFPTVIEVLKGFPAGPARLLSENTQF